MTGRASNNNHKRRQSVVLEKSLAPRSRPGVYSGGGPSQDPYSLVDEFGAEGPPAPASIEIVNTPRWSTRRECPR